MSSDMANLMRSVIVFLAVFSTRATASHFRGGTISWRFLGRSGNAYNIEINFRLGWSLSNSGCSDATIRSQTPQNPEGNWNRNGLLTYSSTNQTNTIICTAYDAGESWGFGYNSFVATVTTSGPFDITYTGNAWISDYFGSGSRWALGLGNIDLGVRSDTGIVNNPPKALISPVVKLIQGCDQVVAITHRDIDNDNVTCRYAVNGRNPDECNTACNGPSSQGYPHFKLDKASCTILYDGGGGTTTVVVSLVLSDHPKTNIVLDGSRSVSTSGFLSEIPLQFVIKIVSASSCNVIPSYPRETIQHGDQIIISNAGIWNKTVFAYSSSSSKTMRQFVVLGPVGMQVSQPLSVGNNLYSALIHWNVGVNHVGIHDACYYASDSGGNVGRTICFSVVVSKTPCILRNGGCSDICKMKGFLRICSCSLPCWILDIDGVTCIPNMTVACSEGNMNVSVADCATSGTVVIGDSLTEFGQEKCQSSHIGNQHVLNWNVSTCGFSYEANPVQLQYSGNLWVWRGVDTGSSVITRGEYRSVQVTCTLPITENVTAGFIPELPFNNESFPINIDVAGFGFFSFYFEFYRTSAYSSVISPSDYPMSVAVNDRFYFAVGAIGQAGFTFFTQECTATTTGQPPLSYTFLRDGCFIDSTLRNISSGSPMEERYTMEAFDFAERITSLRDSVDISLQCKVMLCDSRDINSRCFQGCIQSSRKKRSVFAQIDDDDNHDEPSTERSGPSESPLQNVKGRFVLVADSKSFGGSSTDTPNNLYWILIAIGLALLIIALFVAYRILHSRRVMQSSVAPKVPDLSYKHSNIDA